MVEVPFDAAGARVDAFLAKSLPLSRSRLQHLIEGCNVTIDGLVIAQSSHRLHGGERIIVIEPEPVPVALVPEDLPLTVLYEDDDLLVVNKAAGMAVHPGAGIASGTVANAVLFRCPSVTVGGELRPGIVHRLDKDTSGALIVCKNDDALAELSRAFAERRVDKRYRAYALGGFGDDVDLELVTGHRRADGDRRRFTTKLPAPANGAAATSRTIRLAHSRFHVVGASEGVSVLDVELLTGRTHQIRAHLADVGHPIVQDELYGGGHAEKRLRPSPVREAVVALKRQALHARTIAFAHPRTGTLLRIVAPLPPELVRLERAVLGASAMDQGAAVDTLDEAVGAAFDSMFDPSALALVVTTVGRGVFARVLVPRGAR
ncbi:MAG TPA: RluA family pseudouridine synthase [Myxococcota bacterium]